MYHSSIPHNSGARQTAIIRPTAPPYVRCLYTIRVLDRMANSISCMPCYLTKKLLHEHNEEEFRFLVTHYLVKGSHELYYCNYCFRNLTLNLSANQCTTCIEKYAHVIALIHNFNIDIRYINFTYDILNDQLRYTSVT